MHAENRALRRAYEDGPPLIWFVGVTEGVYEPLYPVWIMAEEADRLQFVLALDEGQRLIIPGAELSAEMKRYVERTNRVRLHQPMFRARVLAAYQSRCSVCRLRHAELLDAAHIIADSKPHGQPVVPNGLAKCRSTTLRSTATSWACDRISPSTSGETCSTRSTDPCFCMASKGCTTRA